jgi:uncharacterized protein YdiU (UPF0061 family)
MMQFAFDNSFVRDLAGLFTPWQPAGSPDPTLLVLNDDVAAELGLAPDELRSPEGLAVLAGNAIPDGAAAVAQVYAGHQFGNYSPRLGDGRALLLGEVIDVHGQRRDLHMKGSGRTPFARGGDGKAAVGPMLREYVIGEAMHALGIATTRVLAVVDTGERVIRDSVLPGAVLTRVAASHIRVGTFQFASGTGDVDLLRRLADHAIARHHPHAAESDQPYLTLLESVVEAQAALIAKWMLVGFVHGVMNTDNMTISGETIDYGPCAFADAYDPATVFSSIDHGGRYAYGNQPRIAQWNLARLAEALLPLLADDTQLAVDRATEVLEGFTARYERHWSSGMRAKLGLTGDLTGDQAGDLIDDLVDRLLGMMQLQRVDMTSCFRALGHAVRGNSEPARLLFAEPHDFDVWAVDWLGLVGTGLVGTGAAASTRSSTDVASAMDQVNPAYIARNHLVEAALSAATEGDLAPVEQLVAVLRSPFIEQPGCNDYARAAPASFFPYRTFCGT